MTHKSVVMRFRQDLRVHDNSALLRAIAFAHDNNLALCPVFVFDDTILRDFPTPDQRLWFVYRAVVQLDQQLRALGSRLHVMIGDPVELLPRLCDTYKAVRVFANQSYGHGAQTRDVALQDIARDASWEIELCNDFLLCGIDVVPVRKVFTPFYKLWSQYTPQHPVSWEWSVHVPTVGPQFSRDDITTRLQDAQWLWSPDDLSERRPVDGGKQRLQKQYAGYDELRNIPSVDGTTQLSPYLRFGLLSCREIYWSFVDWTSDEATKEHIIRELAWREFWYHILHHFPHTGDVAFQEKRAWIIRENNSEYFAARQQGMTWYPLVDAGMRQLQQEWWMHNRVRMVVASFLTKDLLIDRRWGERHFARYLLDYDWAVNTGNRQWSASVGADPKPLRIFNPSLQAKRFDPEWVYITRYCPERSGVAPRVMHDPERYMAEAPYPVIVSHYQRSKLAKDVYAWAKHRYEEGLFSV